MPQLVMFIVYRELLTKGNFDELVDLPIHVIVF